MSASNTIRECSDCGLTVNTWVNPHHCPKCRTLWGEADGDTNPEQSTIECYSLWCRLRLLTGLGLLKATAFVLPEGSYEYEK